MATEPCGLLSERGRATMAKERPRDGGGVERKGVGEKKVDGGKSVGLVGPT